MADALVVDIPESSRYEIRVDGRTVGYAEYHELGSRIAFTHTEIEDALRDRGFGTRLVADAVNDARRKGLEIVPVCPFVADYVRRHPA